MDIAIEGNDGTGFVRAAAIQCVVDGTPGANDMPGRLVFSTTSDGASSPTERLRITSAGLVGIGTSAPQGVIDARADAVAATRVICNNATIADGASTNFDYYLNTTRLGGLVHGFNSGSTYFGIDTWNGSAATRRLTITAGGNLGIGTTSPSYLLQVAGSGSGSQFAIGDSSPRLILDYKSPTSSTAAPTITSDGEGLYYYGKNGGAGSHHVFHSGTSNTERARLDSSGRLLVGTSSGRAVGFSSLQAPVQVETTTAAAYTAVNNTNDANGCYVSIAKTRGTSAGAVTAVQNNDELGAIRISGSDGTGFVVGAQIIAAVDGTPGTNDLPTRLVFSTTADGASSPTERLRITPQAT
jgi:hypothetical protein